MGLYRNIAGIDNNNYGNGRVGLSFYVPPPLNVFAPTTSVIPSYVPTPDNPESQEIRDNAAIAYEAEMNSHYDWLMSHTIQEIDAVPYFVLPGDGSIFEGTMENGVSFLSLDWIQKIENARGTPGALLMHMQEAALAKDTAGYEGGGSGTWYQDNGVTDPAIQQVADPIPEVQSLPPVVATEGGGVSFEAPNYQTGVPTTTTPTTTTPVTSIPIPTDRATAIKNNIVPLAVLAGLVVIAIAGDELLHNRRKIVYLGGVGALFYLMAKKQ